MFRFITTTALPRVPAALLADTADAVAAAAPLPGQDAAPDAVYLCRTAAEVQSLLRELRDLRTPLSLSNPDGARIGAVLWALDEPGRRLSLEVEKGEPQVESIIEGNEVTAIAYLDSIKLQFELGELMLVRKGSQIALQARMPESIYRFQRRSAFRVQPLDHAAPTVTLRHPSMPDMVHALRVVDLSISGCALLWPQDTPPMPLGVTLRGAHLTLEPDVALTMTLKIQHASSIDASGGALRLGCEFTELRPEDELKLSRYIDSIQRRRRVLTLD